MAVVRDMADMSRPMAIVEAPKRCAAMRGKKVSREPYRMIKVATLTRNTPTTLRLARTVPAPLR